MIFLHHVFIVNPVAGKGKALQMIEVIKDRFKDISHTYETIITDAPGHAKELAAQAAANHGSVRIYSVGGDGTLNEVVNGMAGSNAELGIIPCGSGNDAARFLYPVADPIKLIKVLPLSNSLTYDLGKLNDKYFINIASTGFDAEVVLQSRHFKKFPLISGPMSYILGVLSALIKLKRYKLKIVIDDKQPIEKDFLLSIFANGSFYGGGMKAAPSAKMDDGILDFYLVESLPRRRILRFLPLFQKGNHGNMSEVTFKRGAKATVTSDTPFPVNIDGEVSVESSLSLELLPRFIKIIVP